MTFKYMVLTKKLKHQLKKTIKSRAFDNPEDRTINRVEGFHSKLNRLLNTTNLNMYLLINVFKKLETEYAIKMLALADGTIVPRRLPVDISKDKGIELVKEEFRRQSTTVSEFFKKMCAVAGNMHKQ